MLSDSLVQYWPSKYQVPTFYTLDTWTRTDRWTNINGKKGSFYDKFWMNVLSVSDKDLLPQNLITVNHAKVSRISSSNVKILIKR